MTSESSSSEPKPSEPQASGSSVPAPTPARDEVDPPGEDNPAEIIERVIQQLPAEQREVAYSLFYSGPLPPPGQLEHYARIIPGGAERLISMVERQQAHRMQIESKVADSEIWATKRSLNAGSIILGVAVVGAIAAALYGVDWRAVAAIVGVPVAMSIGHIMSRRKKDSPEADHRSDEPHGPEM